MSAYSANVACDAAFPSGVAASEPTAPSTFGESRIDCQKKNMFLFNMASTNARILCWARFYRRLHHFAPAQKMIAPLRAKRRSFWRVPRIRNAFLVTYHLLINLTRLSTLSDKVIKHHTISIDQLKSMYQ